MNFIGFRTLKTAIGATLAIIIAKEIGLEYAVSAGIITILSVQGTKKQSIKIALERVASFVLALIIATVLFNILGYNEIAFGMFILLFIPAAVRLNLKEGIVVSSVLITHLLSQKTVNLFWIINELGLMFVGVGAALILNLYMPSIDKKIKEDQQEIERIMGEIFINMANALKSQQVSIEEEKLFTGLLDRIKDGKSRAYNNFNNYLFYDASYHVEYMEMRLRQFKVMKRMRTHFRRFSIAYDQTLMVARFTEEMSLYIYEENTADNCLIDITVLRENLKNTNLPATREEFENRAMLYQFLNDLEEFIEIKREFKRNVAKEVSQSI